MRARNAAFLTLVALAAPPLRSARAAPPAPTSTAAPSTSVAPPPSSASATTPAEAPGDDAAAIADARRAVEDQRYEDALSILAPLVSSPSRKTRASALEITAVVRLLVGKTAEGREAVASLYEMAPAFQLDDPSLPPRVTRVFDAEAAVPHARAVTLSIRASAEERGVFEIAASQSARAIDLACAAAKPHKFAPVSVTRSREAFRFRLPTLAPHACFAVARDADGLPLGRLGSAARPVDVVVPPPPAPTPLYTRWWLWTSVGVAVAAGVAAGVAVAVTERPSSAPPADLTLRPEATLFSF